MREGTNADKKNWSLQSMRRKKVKRLIVTTAAILAIGIVMAGCGEAAPTTPPDPKAAVEQGPTNEQIAAMSMNPVLVTKSEYTNEDIAAMSMNPPLTEPESSDNSTGPQQPFVPTEAQKRSMLEALAERDRILIGY
jgi:hypothetical protein